VKVLYSPESRSRRWRSRDSAWLFAGERLRRERRGFGRWGGGRL